MAENMFGQLEKLLRENQRLRHQIERLSFENQYLTQRLGEAQRYIGSLEGVLDSQRSALTQVAERYAGSHKTMNEILGELGRTQGELFAFKGVLSGRRDALRMLP